MCGQVQSLRKELFHCHHVIIEVQEGVIERNAALFEGALKGEQVHAICAPPTALILPRAYKAQANSSRKSSAVISPGSGWSGMVNVTMKVNQTAIRWSNHSDNRIFPVACARY